MWLKTIFFCFFYTQKLHLYEFPNWIVFIDLMSYLHIAGNLQGKVTQLLYKLDKDYATLSCRPTIKAIKIK